MPKMEPEILVKCANADFAARDLWRSILQDAYDLSMPARNPYTGTDKGPKPMDKQYDSTAGDGVFKLANRLLMELTPPDQKWADGQVGPLLEAQLKQQYGDKQADKAIEEMNAEILKTMMLIFIVTQSGPFVDAMWEVFIDLIVAGLGVLLAQDSGTDDIDPMVFQCVPQHEVAIADGPTGKLKRVSRKRKMKVREITEVWPAAIVPDNLIPANKKEKDPEIEVLECSYWGGPKGESIWHYDIIYAGENKAVLLHEETFKRSPFHVFRWSKIPGSAYGVSPVMLKLPDIRTLNKVVEMTLQNAALAIAGMYMVRDDGVVNPDNLVIQAGGMIPVGSAGGTMGPSIAPLETGRGFDIGQLITQDMRESVNKGLFNNGLPPLDGKVRSATEFVERQRELTQDIGGAIGRLTRSLSELVSQIAGVMADRGFIPQLPFDQYTFKVQINSPLARSQKLQEVQVIVETIQIAMALGGPELAALAFKMEDVMDRISRLRGVPIDLVRSKDDRAEMQQKLAQFAASQQAGAQPQLQAA
jgi:hypothetical protein